MKTSGKGHFTIADIGQHALGNERLKKEIK